MSLITLLNAHIAFGERPLLDEAQLTVQAGERLGLIGRNGTGKSTLLGVLAGKTPLDDGELQRREGLAPGLVEQEPELARGGNSTRQSAVARAALRPGATRCRLTSREHWRLESRLDGIPASLRARPESRLPATCSGGERKRAALALALALQPDLLLLDEPTNHLDIEAIERLEALLLKVPAAIIITHDRAFLDRITTRIVELDRGVLRSYPGNFAPTRQRKDAGARRRGQRAAPVREVLASRRRSGSARASRRAARATKGACAGSSGCGSSVPRGATGSATCD